MSSPDHPDPAVFFDDFIERVEPMLKRLLAKYPSDVAEDVLQQSLLALLYQWELVSDRERFLVDTVKRLIARLESAAAAEDAEGPNEDDASQ